MTAALRHRRAFEALWNLRGLALFLIGPAIGVILVAAIFGLPWPLQITASGMFAVSLALFGILARAEWRRLASGQGTSPREGGP